MQRNIARISALASKMCQIKKIKSFDYINWYIITNLHDNVPLSFLFDPIYVARAEILAMIFLYFRKI